MYRISFPLLFLLLVPIGAYAGQSVSSADDELQGLAQETKTCMLTMLEQNPDVVKVLEDPSKKALSDIVMEVIKRTCISESIRHRAGSDDGGGDDLDQDPAHLTSYWR